MYRLLGLTVGIVLLIRETPSDQIAGPYTLVTDRLEQCPPELQPKNKYFEATISTIRDRKQPKILYFSVNGTIDVPIDDNLTSVMRVASWNSRGGWKEDAHNMVIKKPFSFLRNSMPYLWRRTCMYMFGVPNRKLPFPSGYYSVPNISTDLDMRFPPALFYGKWRATEKLYSEVLKEDIICLRVYVTVIPRLEVPKM